MEQIDTSELGNPTVTKAIDRLRNNVRRDIPNTDRRAAAAAVVNRVLFSLDKKEPDKGEWVDDETDEEEPEIHHLITGKSIGERKEKITGFNFGRLAGPIYDVENLIPDVEKRYNKFISGASRSLSYDLKQIQDLDSEKIQEMLLDVAVSGKTPLF